MSPSLPLAASDPHAITPRACRQGSGAPASFSITNAELAASDPDTIIICPCGLDLVEGKRELARIQGQDWW